VSHFGTFEANAGLTFEVSQNKNPEKNSRGIVQNQQTNYLTGIVIPLYFFSHPDFTVGSGITPDRPLARFTDFCKSNHRRSGISPCPEEFLFI